ncbi:hypothetical protein RSO01_27880 [Reyranella soli]|jgi:hypothetical protein|uniref:Lipoprotein n=2 Tax=Reyranella soli TaxID=1230389 RepID=A0A512N9G2_9HYPH|nr:hypothetical protein RSO01_27880 [Reyranella soli]
MHRAFMLLVLLLTACEGSVFPAEDPGRQAEIKKSYEARDTCLKRHALADGTSGTEPDALAHAATLACQAETDRLVATANTDGDAKVTASIRHDTEFRAMKYVLQTRGLTAF